MQSGNGTGYTAYTTDQMKLKDDAIDIYEEIYVGWDFVVETANGSADTWSIDLTGAINDGYPYLTNLVPE